MGTEQAATEAQLLAQLLAHAERQTKALETLRTIAVWTVGLCVAALALVLMAVYGEGF